MKETDEYEIKETITLYFDSLETFDDEKMRHVVHPEARMFNVGNSNIFFIKPREEFIKGTITAPRLHGMNPFMVEIKEISIHTHELTASAEVEWRMIMPNSIGVHHTFYHLAKIDDKWVIVNMLDCGREVR